MKKLMLVAMMAVASMGLTGCGILEALLSEPGGTGAGPVAAHPKGGSNTAAKVGGILTALGDAMAPRQQDPSGFFPGEQVVPGVTALEPAPGFSPRAAAPAAEPAFDPAAADDTTTTSDNNKVAKDLPQRGLTDIDSETLQA